MNKDIMCAVGFGKEVDMVENNQCPLCSKPIDPDGFRDDLSRKEYGISGLCQKCQDGVFTPPCEDHSKANMICHSCGAEGQLLQDGKCEACCKEMYG